MYCLCISSPEAQRQWQHRGIFYSFANSWTGENSHVAHDMRAIANFHIIVNHAERFNGYIGTNLSVRVYISQITDHSLVVLQFVRLDLLLQTTLPTNMVPLISQIPTNWIFSIPSLKLRYRWHYFLFEFTIIHFQGSKCRIYHRFLWG